MSTIFKAHTRVCTIINDNYFENSVLKLAVLFFNIFRDPTHMVSALVNVNT